MIDDTARLRFGLCYHCLDGRHPECFGVPCDCACPHGGRDEATDDANCREHKLGLDVPGAGQPEELVSLRERLAVLDAALAVSVELREAERRTEAECHGGDPWHPLVSKRCIEEADVRKRWRAALDAAEEHS